MNPNDDFSFIRFLKVVKTLYESSSFTQLGKTVRSALRKPGEPTIDEEDSSIVDKTPTPVNTLPVEQEEAISDPPPAEQSAILKALVACTSPKAMPECSGLDGKPSSKKSGDDKRILSNTPGDNSQSLLEQVMSCTLNLDGEFSDEEDTYHGRSVNDDDDTYGTDTLGETTTYDSLTDDGYESNRRPRGRSSRPRRNR